MTVVHETCAIRSSSVNTKLIKRTYIYKVIFLLNPIVPLSLRWSRQYMYVYRVILNYWKKIDRQIDRWKLKKRSLAKFSYVQNCLSNFDFALTNNERASERRKIGDRPPSNNLTHTDTLYEKAIDSFRSVDDAERENRQNTIATRSSRKSAILLRKKCEWD